MVTIFHRRGAVRYHLSEWGCPLLPIDVGGSAITYRRGTVRYHQSTWGCTLSPIDVGLSAITYRRGGVSYHLSTWGCQLSPIDVGLSAITYRRGVVSYHLSTWGCQLSPILIVCVHNYIFCSTLNNGKLRIKINGQKWVIITQHNTWARGYSAWGNTCGGISCNA